MNGKNVLSIGYDLTLLQTRQLVLETEGYSVLSVQGNEAGKEAARSRPFDVYVIGHDASHAERYQLLTWLKERFPDKPVVVLRRSRYESFPGADCVGDVDDPREWLKIIAECEPV